MTTSALILGALALALSPYLLLGLVLVVVAGGIQLVPPQLKPVLPAPIRQVTTVHEYMAWHA